MAHDARRGSRGGNDRVTLETAALPHGLTDTHKDRLNQDLLSFLQS